MPGSEPVSHGTASSGTDATPVVSMPSPSPSPSPAVASDSAQAVHAVLSSPLKLPLPMPIPLLASNFPVARSSASLWAVADASSRTITRWAESTPSGAVALNGIGLTATLPLPMQTVEEARLGVLPGDAASWSGRATPGVGPAVDMAVVASNVWSVLFEESEWNERWQRLVEKSGWSFERSVERGVAMASLMGRMARSARDTVETVVHELGLPNHAKSVQQLNPSAADSTAVPRKPVFYHDGLFVQLAVDQPSNMYAVVYSPAR
jgi:hypothetical protein